MKYTGKAQNQVTGQEWTTRAYDSYEAAHKAAEKLAGRHIPAGNAFIYVVDDHGRTGACTGFLCPHPAGNAFIYVVDDSGERV